MTEGTSRRTLVMVDDHRLFRDSLEPLLSPRFEVVATGSTSVDAVTLSASIRPAVLLLDVELGGAPAETTIRSIRRSAPATTIVVLTMFEDAVLRRQLLAAGASAYVTKSVSGAELIDRIDEALERPQHTEPPDEPEHAGLLSEREMQVLRLIGGALSNGRIATELSISEGTVKRHTTNIYVKLGAANRLDAVRRATRLGLL